MRRRSQRFWIWRRERHAGRPDVRQRGARIDEGALALEAYADIFARMARMSGVVPMISMVLGPCVGAAALMSEMSDVTIMVKGVGAKLSCGPQVLSRDLWREQDRRAARRRGGHERAGRNGLSCATARRMPSSRRSALLSCSRSTIWRRRRWIRRRISIAYARALRLVRTRRRFCPRCATWAAFWSSARATARPWTALCKMGGRTVAVVHTGAGELCNKAREEDRAVRALCGLL